MKLRFDPGTRFSYSGMAFVYLQRVVEKLTETPFERYIADNFFGALGMESASLVWRADYETRLAHGHTLNGKASRGVMREADAASSLVCTADDYARFVQFLLDPDAKGALRLNAETMGLLLEAHSTVVEGIAWGLGWGIQQTPAGDSYWHWGNNGNRYHAFVVWSREAKEGAVVFTNSGNGLKLCKDLIPRVTGGEHPAFDWKMVVR